MDIQELLTVAVTRNASDLHIVSGHLPTIRVQGELHPLVTYPEITADEIEKMVFSLLTGTQKDLLVTNRELDFSVVYEFEGGRTVRFRTNAYYQKGTLAAAFRVIPGIVPTLSELHLPADLIEFTKLKQGLVLITGATGQGKSTTLASLINEINKSRRVHVVTIEDPIEYVYPKEKAMISQREMYGDTHSWASALKVVLREDPDVVFIGEMRDLETVASVLTIAETGHLVFSTLHTNTAAQTIDRIIDIFPPVKQDQVKLQLSMVLAGTVTQRLVPGVDGMRLPVCEVLVGTASIKNTLREGKTHLIDNIIQTSSDVGMRLFEEDLKDKVKNNLITHEVALEYAFRPDTYLQLIER
ncbi:PilT/PilU family type 4a pilus ATPase [Candidatus Gottesmanbacteria bacterium]|nr:PilT/PilU family type 4a pilus ATPase [Candidatus Gottesmanbacteria bacterium]